MAGAVPQSQASCRWKSRSYCSNTRICMPWWYAK
nr:MAG TPA: hypothetical protein [Caudoviricetes sp.]